VDEAFAGVAADYDRLVRLFSGGLDRRWRQRCIEACGVARGGWVLDCATGTGALALAAAQQAGATGRVVAVDTCGPMLAQASRKALEINTPVAWVQADVEHLPLRSDTVSTITLGLGLRHLEVKAALGEMSRVLVPGGRVALLDFLQPPPGVIPRLALAYLRLLVPPLAGLVAWSRAACTLAAYLPRTIEAAPSVPDLVEAVESAGLRLVRIESLFAHVVWLVVAMKPLRGSTHRVAG
ncbi:MAG: class I SAM-dependent methyltransferase, partial [candidate division NC10 bacterium]|nr:class I SAM-dependent methyltransferase [candidate division NC10 bacterium]